MECIISDSGEGLLGMARQLAMADKVAFLAWMLLSDYFCC